MSLVSEIIQRAYREPNIIPLGGTPNSAQTAEALSLLNTIILQTFGNEAGDPLGHINYGGDFDESDCITDWVPDDTRLYLNLSAAASLDADPYPYEGQRLAFVDVAGNLATHNLVISGNGRLIEGATSITLNTNSDARQWMYRGDTGNWVRIEALEAGDSMPLSEEFDDFFITALAIRLEPLYGLTLPAESGMTFKKARQRIRARYRCRKAYYEPDYGLVKYDGWYGWYGDEFDKGHMSWR